MEQLSQNENINDMVVRNKKLEKLLLLSLVNRTVRLKNKNGYYRVVRNVRDDGIHFVSTNLKNAMDIYCDINEILDILT